MRGLRSARLAPVRWGQASSSCAGVLAAGVVAAPLAGCFSEPRGFDSPSPNRRLDAIAESAGSKDQQSLRALVVALESPDPAERMLSIRALEAREGTTLGYKHDDPYWVRREAVDRWWARVEGATTENGPEVEESPDAGASGGSGVRIAPETAPGQRALRSGGVGTDLRAGWAPEETDG